MSHPLADQNRLAIRQLPTHLANQIAAGEVVERPASIVKELLENSIDAGATQITLSLDKGGVQLINVLDNGWGIPAEELELALAPHATSKIYRAEDLSAIGSMGFRGEALASIASVSRLSITSRTVECENAWQLFSSHGEQKPQLKPAAHPTGTSVRVEELFFNIPARRRFLRGERTEYRHCEDVVRRLVLSHFSIGFKLIHNNKTIFNFSVANTESAIRARLQKFAGKAFTLQALPLSYEASGLHLHGWVAPPELARPQNDLQLFFVNHRIIRDRLVSHALRQAYSDQIFPGRHPAYILFLEIEYGEIDVNVHPTKHEVRFHQARLVHDFLSSGVQHAFQQQAQHPSLATASEPPTSQQPEHIPHSSVMVGAVKTRQSMSSERMPTPAQDSRINLAEQSHRYHRPTNQLIEEQHTRTNMLMYQRFGLFQHETNWGMFDLTAYWYETIKQSLKNRLAPEQLKPMLFPQLFELDDEAFSRLEPLLTKLKELGLDFKEIDINKLEQNTQQTKHITTQLRLSQLPTILANIPVKEFITDFLAYLTEKQVKQTELLQTLAHQSATVLSQEANDETFNDALAQLKQQLSKETFWQHPAVKRLTLAELEQMFKTE